MAKVTVVKHPLSSESARKSIEGGSTKPNKSLLRRCMLPPENAIILPGNFGEVLRRREAEARLPDDLRLALALCIGIGSESAYSAIEEAIAESGIPKETVMAHVADMLRKMIGSYCNAEAREAVELLSCVRDAAGRLGLEAERESAMSAMEPHLKSLGLEGRTDFSGELLTEAERHALMAAMDEDGEVPFGVTLEGARKPPKEE